MKRDTNSKRAIAQLGATAALVVAVIGAAVGGHLALLGLQVDASPCTVATLCPGDPSGACVEALRSPWASLLGLPLGVWIAAFYALAALLALAAWLRPRLFGGLAPHLLVALGVIDVIVSMTMATIAARTLTSACSPCLALYGASVLLLVAALLVALAAPPRRRRLRARDPALVEAVFWSASVLVALVGTQAIAAQILRARLDPAEGCPQVPPLAAIPTAGVVFGADAPTAVIAAFLDPASPRSREEFRALTGLVGRRALPAPVQLRLYHYPREAGGCLPGDLPLRFAAFEVESTENHACQAALAIECVEALAPGLGIRMAGAVFDLQDGSTPYFTPVKLGRAARAVGLPIDPDDPQNALFTCMTGDAAVAGRIREHLRFAARHGVREAPHGYVIAATGARLDPTRAEAYRGRLGEPLLRRKLASVTR